MKAVRYPAESYRRLYDASAGPLWTSQQGLALEEDGDHYEPVRDFFEWWYFDAAFQNGYQIVAIFHSSLYNAVDHKPTMDIRVTPPVKASGLESTVAAGRYSRQEYRSSPDSCDLQIAGCHVKVTGPGRYHLHLNQDRVAADLHYEALAPGWKYGTGYLFLDQATGHFFKWVVPLPAAQVSGTLSIDGQRMQVEGMGYHDHNWGNFVLGDAFKSWQWGRMVAKRDGVPWAAAFGDLTGRGEEPVRVQPFMMVSRGEILADEPTLAFHPSQLAVEPKTGVEYPACLNLSAAAPSYRAGVSLQMKKFMEALDFANPPFKSRFPRQLAEMAFYLSPDRGGIRKLVQHVLGKGSYLRMQADACLNFTNLQQDSSVQLNGQGIFEVMQF